jgi:tetratricopeptide (TPR) repeat protein
MALSKFPIHGRRILVWLLCCSLSTTAQSVDPAGDAEIAAGNFLRARAIFTATAERLGSIVGTTESQFHAAYLRQLETELLTGDYAVASRTAQAMLAKVSKTPEQQAQVHLLQGRIAIEKGDFDAAAGFFERATAAGGTALNLARAGIAETLRRQEKFPAALKQFTEAASMLAREGRPLPGEVVLGPLEIMVSLGRYADAQREIASIRKTWKPGPTHPDTIHLRNLAGYVAYRLGDLEQASKEVAGNEQAVETAAGPLHPEFSESVAAQAFIAQVRGEDRPAQALFDRLGKIVAGLADQTPRKGRLQLRLGAWLLARGDGAGAQKQFMEALKLRNAYAGENSVAAAEASAMVALTEIQAGRHSLAGNYLTRATSSFNANQVDAAQEYRLAADYAQAAVLYREKDLAGAKTILTRWYPLAKLPTDTGAARGREILGEILLAEGKAADAAKFFKESLDMENALRLGPAEPARISLLVAKARFKAADLPGTVSMLEAVLKRDESRNALPPLEVAAAHRLLGDVYTAMRLPANAASEFQAAMKMYEGRMPASDPAFLSLMSSTAAAMVDSKRFADATPLLSRLLTLRDQTEDKYSPESLSIVSRLADLHFESARFPLATPLYERLIDATLKGKTIGDRKTLLERVGEAYARGGRREEAARAYDQRSRLALDRHAYAEAEEFARKIQNTIGTSASGAEQRASALNILGDVRSAQGKREEAEQFYREAVGLASGQKLIEASSLNGLGRLALKQKDLPGAKTQLERALTLVAGDGAPASQQRTKGLEAMIVANLAAVNAVSGDTPASLDLYTRFLKLESETTVDDPPLIEYLDEAANLYARTPGKSDDVEELYRRRLTASGRSFGNASPETAYAHYNLAELYALKKAYPRALEEYREALKIFEALKGPESDEVVTILTGIASTQSKAGDAEAAIATYGTLLTIAGKSTADGPRKTTAVLNSLGLAYRQAGRHAEARETFQKIVTMWTSQGAAEPAWVAASRNAGMSYFDEGLIKEGSTALASLRAAIRRAAGNRDSQAELDVLRALSQGLKKQNRTKESDDASRQADAMEKRLATAKK